VQTVVPSGFFTVTVEPGSAEPETVIGPFEGDGATVTPVGAIGPVVSRTAGAVAAGETLPAGSVEVTDTLPEPVSVPEHEYVFPAVAVVVQMVVPSGFFTVTVEPASAVPEAVIGPVVGEVANVTVGSVGAVVSRTAGLVAAGDTLPAGSVAVTETLPVPVNVPGHENVPPAVAVVVQSVVPSGFFTVTVEPASAEPVTVTGPFEGEGATVTPVGAFGAVVSRTAGLVAAGETLPAGSVAVTATLPEPFSVPEQVKVPAAVAVVVHSGVPSGFFTVTVEPGSAEPETVTGPVVGDGATVTPVGAPGPLVSSTAGAVAAGETLPAGSVEVTETLPEPVRVPEQE
jgi:hypothetical protein